MAISDLKKSSERPLAGLKQTFGSFFDRFKRKNGANVVGLDFTSGYVKALKIGKTNGQYLVEQFYVEPVPEGMITKDEIKDEAAVGALLKDMFKKADIDTKNVAFAIPRSSAIIKTILIDNRLTADEIESRAWIEANRLFPDLVGDIYLDFAITGPAPQDNTQLEMILVACRKDQMKPYLEVLKQAGMTPQFVDVNSYALARALQIAEAITEPTALLNLNMNLSSFIVVNDDMLLHAHDQTYDGARLISQTTNYLNENNIKPNEENVIPDDPAYNEILKESLISHLRHTIHFFYSSRPNVTVRNIILGGDCALVPNLAFFIQREIGLQTKIANPFASMTIAPNIDAGNLKTYAPTLMLCCGLALCADG